MRYYIVFQILISIHVVGFSQNILLDEKPQLDTIPDSFGAGRKHFVHSTLGYGMMVDQSKDAGIKMKYPSGGVRVGFRYKNQLSRQLGTGFTLQYESNAFLIDQKNAQKVFPDTLVHTSEKIFLNQISLDGFFRINLGKRGNSLGKYLDFFAYGAWNYSRKHIFTDKDAFAYGKNTETEISGVSWLLPFHYGGGVRLGFNKIAFYGRYRYSRAIQSPYQYIENNIAKEKSYPDLPQIDAGIDIVLGK